MVFVFRPQSATLTRGQRSSGDRQRRPRPLSAKPLRSPATAADGTVSSIHHDASSATSGMMNETQPHATGSGGTGAKWAFTASTSQGPNAAGHRRPTSASRARSLHSRDRKQRPHSAVTRSLHPLIKPDDIRVMIEDIYALCETLRASPEFVSALQRNIQSYHGKPDMMMLKALRDSMLEHKSITLSVLRKIEARERVLSCLATFVTETNPENANKVLATPQLAAAVDPMATPNHQGVTNASITLNDTTMLAAETTVPNLGSVSGSNMHTPRFTPPVSSAGASMSEKLVSSARAQSSVSVDPPQALGARRTSFGGTSIASTTATGMGRATLSGAAPLRGIASVASVHSATPRATSTGAATSDDDDDPPPAMNPVKQAEGEAILQSLQQCDVGVADALQKWETSAQRVLHERMPSFSWRGVDYVRKMAQDAVLLHRVKHVWSQQAQIYEVKAEQNPQTTEELTKKQRKERDRAAQQQLRLDTAAAKIQATYRAHREHQRYEFARWKWRAAIVIQRGYRRRMRRQAIAKIRIYAEVATRIQNAWRMYAQRTKFLAEVRRHRAAKSIQKLYRSFRNWQRVHRQAAQMMARRVAATAVQTAARSAISRAIAAELRDRRKAVQNIEGWVEAVWTRRMDTVRVEKMRQAKAAENNKKFARSIVLELVDTAATLPVVPVPVDGKAQRQRRAVATRTVEGGDVEVATRSNIDQLDATPMGENRAAAVYKGSVDGEKPPGVSVLARPFWAGELPRAVKIQATWRMHQERNTALRRAARVLARREASMRKEEVAHHATVIAAFMRARYSTLGVAHLPDPRESAAVTLQRWWRVLHRQLAAQRQPIVLRPSSKRGSLSEPRRSSAADRSHAAQPTMASSSQPHHRPQNQRPQSATRHRAPAQQQQQQQQEQQNVSPSPARHEVPSQQSHHSPAAVKPRITAWAASSSPAGGGVSPRRPPSASSSRSHTGRSNGSLARRGLPLPYTAEELERMKREKNAAMKISGFFARLLQRHREKQAARHIAGAWLAHQVVRRLHEEAEAVQTRIDAFNKHRRTERLIAARNQQRREAALAIIVFYWKQRHDRHLRKLNAHGADVRRREFAETAAQERRERAASAIQRSWRVSWARREMELRRDERRAARKLSAARSSEKAATAIQAEYRRHLHRDELSERRVAFLAPRVTLVQSAMRAFVSRYLARQKRMQSTSMFKETKTLQNARHQ